MPPLNTNIRTDNLNIRILLFIAQNADIFGNTIIETDEY